eukprot:6006054-Prymnesium_polylepis.1
MVWTPGVDERKVVQGFNGSFVNVALWILPAGSPTPTHAAMGWRPRVTAPTLAPEENGACRGHM